MYESIQDFFASVANGEFGSAAIGEFWSTFAASSIYVEIESLVTSLLPAIAIVGVLLALSLVQLFVGKKLIGFQKFLAFFAIGFACGVMFLAPVVDTIMVLPPWISGLVVGLVAALLCKPLYFLSYIFTAGYSVFAICFVGEFLPEVTAFTQGNLIYSLVAGGVALILALILRKWVETLLSAFLGAWCTFQCVDALVGGLENMLADSTELVMWIAVGVLTLIGFIVQVKTRRRY